MLDQLKRADAPPISPDIAFADFTEGIRSDPKGSEAIRRDPKRSEGIRSDPKVA
jgi:hypothetical protein